MGTEKEYFELRIEDLRSLGAWAADCAERALPIYEGLVPGDRRPREAIGGIREFAAVGKRTQGLRKLAMEAYRASRETENAAAAAAARAASLAAASAYTHPFRDIDQAKHILGPAAYSAWALELFGEGLEEIGAGELGLFISSAPQGAADILFQMPPQSLGKTRIERLFHELDKGIRVRFQSALHSPVPRLYLS